MSRKLSKKQRAKQQAKSRYDKCHWALFGFLGYRDLPGCWFEEVMILKGKFKTLGIKTMGEVRAAGLLEAPRRWKL